MGSSKFISLGIPKLQYMITHIHYLLEKSCARRCHALRAFGSPNQQSLPFHPGPNMRDDPSIGNACVTNTLRKCRVRRAEHLRILKLSMPGTEIPERCCRL